ncbi:LysR family transcriptional regulator [Uliginosibacterium sediminicola]|uniref:LysR family transcriptional regulator n=1 Tax=Uliginosibacterium sediminicola TaxID=2024550 RepID=A0ABU9YTY8_9RHOO
MKLNQLDGVLAFVTVAQKRGFTAAAAQLEVTPSAVSQAVKQLEDRLGVRLFNRSTRSVSLTEAGTCFYGRVAPALGELTEAAQVLDVYRAGPTGLLRINAPNVVWEIFLRRVVAGFLAEQPGMRVEVQLEDGFVDIIEQGFDAGIRLGESVQRDMVAAVLTRSEQSCVVASPDYVKRRGVPATIESLSEHACVRFRFRGSGSVYRWELMREGQIVEVEVDGPLTLSDSRSLREAALDGIGIVYTFQRLVADDLAAGRLVPVLADHWIRFGGFSLYYPNRAQMPAKLRMFIDYCKAALRELEATTPKALPL